MTELELTLVQAEGIILQEKASSVNLPGLQGKIEILPDHEPMIIELTKGPIIFNERSFYLEEKGIALVTSSSCKIIIYP